MLTIANDENLAAFRNTAYINVASNPSGSPCRVCKRFAFFDNIRNKKELWNNKSDFSGNYNDLTNIPTFSIEKHTDGLIYIFINGVPTGTGLDINTISDTTEE